ncbi:MAG: hypothetical protein M1816_002576 [Peltula sp. TS41687]|nr:MAG: hypothetical protein M1816_002576 [Peltula sp. TS41687]
MTSSSKHIFMSILLLLANFFGYVDCFWRLPCNGRAGVARIDPLAQHGRVGNHAHVIHGGNNFGFDSAYSDLIKSECTSCGVKQDRSVYWTPALYFESPDGTVELVNQVGGMLVYYLLFGEKVQAFPAGFQIIAGDAYRRNFTLPVPDPPKSEWAGDAITEYSLRQKAVGFNCLNYGKNPEPTLFRHFFPDKTYLDANCPDGLRFELMFPSCWAGEEDSTDHMSHVAYPDQVITGNCPEKFNRRLPSMLFETIWDTNAFKGKAGRFLISNGDPTGYGYHGDFMNGWDPDFLQQAIETCTNPSGKVEDCPLFELQSQPEQNKCNIDPLPTLCADEDTKGPRQGLPGDVKVFSGPDDAKKPAGASSISPAAESTSAVTSTSAPAPSTEMVVPTLSYTSASESNTVITAANVVKPSESVTPDTDTTVTASKSTESDIVSAESVNISTESSDTSVKSTTDLTESRTIPTPVSSDLSTSAPPASMTSYTTDGTLVNVFLVRETVTVTVDVDAVVMTSISTTAAGYRKRAAGVHHHGHRRFL